MLFHWSSFLVLLSLFESFGLVAAEAMATGLPVVITNRTGPRDFTSAETAIAVNPESVEYIGDGILQMIENLDDFDAAEIRRFVINGLGFEAYRAKIKALSRIGL